MDGTVELSTEFDNLDDTGTADHDDIDFDLSTPRDQPAFSDIELPKDIQPSGNQRGRIPSIVITEPSCANLVSLGESNKDVNDDEIKSKANVDESEAKSGEESSDIVKEQPDNLFDDSNGKNENEPEKSASDINKSQDEERNEHHEDVKQVEVTDKYEIDVTGDKTEDLNMLSGDTDGFKQEKNVSQMIDQLHRTGADKQEDEVEKEVDVTVSLDNIMMNDKTEDDSDSEFDFDLPTPAINSSTVKPVQQESTVKPVQTGPQVNKGQPEMTITTATSHDLITGSPLPQQSNISSQKPDHNTGSHSPQASSSGIQKPVAVIKPTSQPAQAPYVVPPPPDEGTQHMLESAQAEWDNVTTVQAGYKETDVTVKGVEPTVVQTVKPMTSQELLQIIKREDFSQVRASIKPVVERHGLSAFVNYLFGPPKLHPNLLDERDRVFCLAASQLNNENSAHMRTLQTIYRCLTGSKFDCPRIGGHWEEIGFQGTDPATDLRGAGILGVVNLLHILKDGKVHQLASDIYRLSLHPTQNFPFCVMGINLSRITLQVLREGLLNKECNRRHEVVCVVNDFYAGLYLHLYQIWKGQGKTISDSGFVIKAKKSPKRLFRKNAINLNKKTVVIATSPIDIGGDNFVNVLMRKMPIH
ncbi:uncharacterized protein LOC132742945 [Ruditapes philippinarum]|uniref:uncharacterized protein LOC132742945 n=1 Tax=Ruditapes philippinarum TaxID=129788 RepID=UPI00295AB769|nr:uncharacterized protein LOC132742945 [Ruditapes philippinarum]